MDLRRGIMNLEGQIVEVKPFITEELIKSCKGKLKSTPISSR
jgi:hypothetical protein